MKQKDIDIKPVPFCLCHSGKAQFFFVMPPSGSCMTDLAFILMRSLLPPVEIYPQKTL